MWPTLRGWFHRPNEVKTTEIFSFELKLGNYNYKERVRVLYRLIEKRAKLRRYMSSCFSLIVMWICFWTWTFQRLASRSTLRVSHSFLLTIWLGRGLLQLIKLSQGVQLQLFVWFQCTGSSYMWVRMKLYRQTSGWIRLWRTPSTVFLLLIIIFLLIGSILMAYVQNTSLS